MHAIFDLITNIVLFFVRGISGVFSEIALETMGFELAHEFVSRPINFSLFSDNVIFSTNLFELILFISTLIFTIIIIKFLIKATKKFINMIFGVFRV